MALFRRSQPSDDDMVNLADDDYAWWAGRDELQRVFVPKKRDATGTAVSEAAAIATKSDFAERYSAESLFNWASNPEPDDPTFGGKGVPLDPYQVLGLQPGATLSEVVAAHRALAKQFHPDQQHGTDDAVRVAAAQRMSMINAAYQELRSRLMIHRHTV